MEKKAESTSYSEFPLYVFHQGRNFKAQEFLGAHRVSEDKYVFRVWAPHAAAIYVVGDFNGWNEDASPMGKLNDAGVWEAYVDNVKDFDAYKFLIYTCF